jgi:hypothetical protein
MTALARFAAALAALVFALRALAVIAEARVPLWPGWVVPVPAALLATAALLALALGARFALALLAGRSVLPYVAVAVTWRETER